MDIRKTYKFTEIGDDEYEVTHRASGDGLAIVSWSCWTRKGWTAEAYPSTGYYGAPTKAMGRTRIEAVRSLLSLRRAASRNGEASKNARVALVIKARKKGSGNTKTRWWTPDLVE
jgi:hypothetical protein